jgi:hypothetical protein
VTVGIRSAVVASNLAERLEQPFWPSKIAHRVALGLGLVLASALRSVRLMDLFPVLVDEAIYMRWAEIIQHRHTWFISLLDGKPPLAYWIFAAVRLIFPDEPLLGSRLVSVLAGVLSTLVLYRVGFLCAGPVAGIITALLYSVLPFGVFYDRIAYVDSLTNLCGALLVYTALTAFGRPSPAWSRTLAMGLTLGAALFTKTTILLFALAPLAIGLHLQPNLRELARHLLAAYGVAVLFPLSSPFAIPPGPAFEVNSVLLHHTNFFTPVEDLLRDPFFDLRVNGPLLASYADRYVTYPALIAAAAGAAVLLRLRRGLPVVTLLACVLPVSAAVATLEYFPSRYVFPHAWPLLLVVACAASAPDIRRHMRLGGYVATAMVFGAMSVQSARILRMPESALHERDADEFLGSSPYSGSGVRDAIAWLRAEARHGPMTILADPWWGPPTDAVFAYLNENDGIKVYEAWWLQLEGKYPLVPRGEMPVWRSQYQRVSAGEIDFSSLARLYYVTDTNYQTPAEVYSASPAAWLIRRFPKHGGREFIDVYRLDCRGGSQTGDTTLRVPQETDTGRAMDCDLEGIGARCGIGASESGSLCCVDGAHGLATAAGRRSCCLRSCESGMPSRS